MLGLTPDETRNYLVISTFGGGPNFGAFGGSPEALASFASLVIRP